MLVLLIVAGCLEKPVAGPSQAPDSETTSSDERTRADSRGETAAPRQDLSGEIPRVTDAVDAGGDGGSLWEVLDLVDTGPLDVVEVVADLSDGKVIPDLSALEVDAQPDLAVVEEVAPEVEVVCVPNCESKVCGDDGCGGSCGMCQALPPMKCLDGQCVCSEPLSPTIKYAKQFGGPDDDQLFGVAPGPDGTYLAVGERGVGVPLGAQGWWARFSSDGDATLEKTFGGEGVDRFRTVVAQPGGEVLAIGWTTSTGQGKEDGWVLRVDYEGNKIDEATLGGAGDDAFYGACAVEGGVVLVGRTASKGQGSNDVWLVRLDENLDLVWERTFGGPSADEGMSVRPLPEGGLAVAGNTWSKGAGGADIWLLRVDPEGYATWDKTFGGGEEDRCYYGDSLAVTPEGDIAVVAMTKSGGSGDFDWYLLRVAKSGDVTLSKYFGGAGMDRAYAVEYQPDGGFLMGGYVTPGGEAACQGTLVRTNGAGEQLWTLVLPPAVGQSWIVGLDSLPGGGWLASGAAAAVVGGKSDGFYVRTGPEVCGCTPDCEGKSCGSDGCGGTCGQCGSLEECATTKTGASCAALSVEVPAGSFWMGCNNCAGSAVNDPSCGSNEHPYHEVYLDAYQIDRTEVTAAQYLACKSSGGCTAAGSGTYATYQVGGKEKHPVNFVTWSQAEDYCQWVEKQLCTEAQWEKGARGGCEKNGGNSNCKAQSRKYPWGNDEASCQFAVMDEGGDGCATGSTMAVCSKSPAGDSPYGLCDMAGNVWEWTGDWYQEDYYCDGPGATGDEYCAACGPWPGSPSAWEDPLCTIGSSSRVGRGGSLNVGDTYLRVSNRNFIVPSDGYAYVGFRCCGPQ